MKPLLSVKLIVVALAAGLFSCSSSQYAQNGSSEYDDLYFNSSDRTPVLASTSQRTVVERPVDSSSEEIGVGVGYNSKTINPDYGLPQDAEAESNYQEDEYFVEDYDKEYIQDAVDDYLRSSAYSVRRSNRISYYQDFDNIYWSDPLFYQGTIFDHLYRAHYGVYSPFAYRSYYRPYSSFYGGYGRGLSVNLNFGFGFGRYGRGYNRYYDPFFDPFYYGRGYYGGFGQSYYGGFGYGNIWCPPSYYGRANNVIIVNNNENARSGNIRYGRRAPRGSNGIANNNGIRQRTTNTPSSAERVRVRDRNATTGANERTRSTTGTSERSGLNTDRIRSRDGRVGSPAERPNTNTRSSSTNRSNERINSRTRPSGNLDQRGTINKDAYRRPQRSTDSNRSRTTTPSRNRNYSPNPSRSSGSRYGGTPSRNTPSRTRSSSPSRSSTPNRTRSSSPSRSSTPNRTRSSSPSRSTPSRTRTSGSSSKTRTRN